MKSVTIRDKNNKEKKQPRMVRVDFDAVEPISTANTMPEASGALLSHKPRNMRHKLNNIS